RRRIHVMPNGVNAELFYPRSGVPAQRRKPASKKSKRLCPEAAGETLGFVGGLRPWHGVEILPDLLAQLRKRHRDTPLIIVGDGPLKAHLKRALQRRGLTRNIRFAGVLPHEQVPGVIRTFDVALAPYPKHDHDFYFSPLKLFEYMACGAAVVAPRQGQI